MTPSTLLFRLQGPLQSWGTGPGLVKTTAPLPTRSGILGLISGAMGEDTTNRISHLKVGVRVDKPGLITTDFQTGRNVVLGTGKAFKETVVTEKHYIADGAFLAGLSGDSVLLPAIWHFLADPIYPPYLGRTKCPPSPPVFLPDGLTPSSLVEALQTYPELVKSPLGYVFFEEAAGGGMTEMTRATFTMYKPLTHAY